nr:MAG TPA: hypothetical protein [Caudoviricetes sp.]
MQQMSQIFSALAQVMTVLFSEISGDLPFSAAPPHIPRRITPRWWVVSSFVSIGKSEFVKE